MSQRFEITCPHCRRSYLLRVDPENLSDAAAKIRCGRCRKRFRLSTAVTASEQKGAEVVDRSTYRRRISRPMMRAVDIAEAQNPAKMVDDMALAFERALQERRRQRLDGLTATEAVLPLEDDEPAVDTTSAEARVTPAEQAPVVRKKRRITPRVAFRFTPPPLAREIILGANLGALDDPAADEITPEPDDVDAPTSSPPSSAPTDEEPQRRSSRPPRPREVHTSAPPPREPNAAARRAWLDFADEALSTLVAEKSASVTALEWLLGEDALHDA